MDITSFKGLWSKMNNLYAGFIKSRKLLDENALNGIYELSKKYGLNIYEEITNCFAKKMNDMFYQADYLRNYGRPESEKFYLMQYFQNEIDCFNQMLNSIVISLTAIEMRSYAKGKADCTPIVTNRYYSPAGPSLRDALPTDINELSYLDSSEVEKIVFGLSDDACGKINVG